MSDCWWELRLTTRAASAEDLAGLLVDGGALGVELMPCRSDQIELVVSYDGELPRAEVEALAADGLAALGLDVNGADLTIAQRADEAWATNWKTYFQPLALGRRLWVVPSWEREFVPPAGACVLTLDPGMAFGTGQHATTVLCLEWLEEELAARPGARLLDVGCGSGILAIAAAKLGARSVVAIDNDPDAVAVCAENARTNAVLVEMSTTPLAALAEPAELVVANILADTLTALASELVRHTTVDGRLAVSGVLRGQSHTVCEAILAASRSRRWHCLEQREREPWVLLSFGA